MLEANSLCKVYGNTVAVKDLDLKVGPGEIYCMLGANGAGKTTTVNCFLNFIEPTSGPLESTGLTSRKCQWRQKSMWRIYRKM